MTRPAPLFATLLPLLAAVAPASRPASRPASGPAVDDRQRVVFLVDASAAVADVFPQVRAELKRAIAEIPDRSPNGYPSQLNVIFFDATAKPRAMYPHGPQPQTPFSKPRVTYFIDAARPGTGGKGQPAAAIRPALARDPQLLYLLSGDLPSAAGATALVDAVRQRDRDGRTTVRVIYLQGDAADPATVAALQEVARIGHGQFIAMLKKDIKPEP